ncbi:polysaccharide deacetylase family protein [candidate division KSB1 bacterium]|nr:polysaccharide deacetylase family protein [candidate division KSB1 bacterium]
MPKSKKITYCENHPDVVSNDNCIHCDKAICYNCRKKAYGKSFCSESCKRNYVFSRMSDYLLGFFVTPLKFLKDRFARLRQGSLLAFLEVLILAGLVFCVIQLVRINEQVQELDIEIKRSHVQTDVADTTYLPPVQISAPVKGGMVTSSRIDITGYAESNWIISLSIDDALKEVQLPKNGEFAFRQVRLNRGENRLQVRALNPDGEVYVLQTLALHYGTPHLDFLVKDFRRGSIRKKEVAFTFDGGSLDNAAEPILSALEEAGIKATFFLTGTFIKDYPKTVKQISDAGHVIGNHTWSHPHLTSFSENRKQQTMPTASEEKLREELNKTASLYKVVTGEEMAHIWRAPYGEYNPEVLGWAAKVGYKHIAWTTGRGWAETGDTMDWVTDKTSSAYHSSDEIVKKVLNFTKNGRTGANGTIMLMHLGTNRTEDFPHERLPEMIAGFQKKGYQLVTIPDMLYGSD